MSTPLLDLFVRLSLDASEYEAGIKEVKGSGESFAVSFSKAFKAAAKATVAAFTTAGTAVSVITKQSVDAFSSYEQLWGGVQKLYGNAGMSLEDYAKANKKTTEEVREEWEYLEESQNRVLANAQQAFLTSGMSVNQYMETATQFSAALIKSLGGDMEEAARITDVAMQAMSDNVNTFGSDIEFVSNAFKGLSRNNYTMIDNLKLGYAGTATGMMELINDSGVLGKTLTDTSELAEVGFAKMVEAIQAVQKAQGIAGTTAREAMHTIEGSANATKAAWQNVLTAIGKGEGVSEAFEGLTTALLGDESGGGLINNIIPRVKTVMEAIGNSVVEFAPFIIEKIPELIAEIAPSLFESTLSLISSVWNLVKSKAPEMIQAGLDFLTGFSSGLVEGIPQMLDNVLPIIESLTAKFHDFVGKLVDTGLELLLGLVKGIANGLPQLIAYVPQIVINIANTINDNMPKILATAWEMVKTIIRGIIDSLPALKENAGKIVEAIFSVIQAINWLDLGKKIITGIINGIKAMVGSVGEGMKNVAKTAFDNFKSGMKWDELGKNIIEGIKNGVVGAAKGLANTVVNAASNALNAVKGFLGIRSPSKVMRDQVGKWMSIGLGEGFEDNMPIDEMVSTVKDAVKEVSKASVFEIGDAPEFKIDRYNEPLMPSAFGGIVINVYGEDKSVTEIAEEVNRILQKQITSVRRVYR